MVHCIHGLIRISHYVAIQSQQMLYCHAVLCTTVKFSGQRKKTDVYDSILAAFGDAHRATMSCIRGKLHCHEDRFICVLISNINNNNHSQFVAEMVLAELQHGIYVK